MAMRSFFKEIRSMKVTELPSYLKPMFTLGYVKKTLATITTPNTSRPTPSILSSTFVSEEWLSPTSSPSLKSAATSSTPRNTPPPPTDESTPNLGAAASTECISKLM